MKIAADSINVTNVPVTEIMRARVSDARLTLPVKGALYARLRHITGVPSSGSTNAYPVSTLRNLDILIDRLKRLGQAGGLLTDVDGLNGKELQSLVDTAGARLHKQALKNNTSQYAPGTALFEGVTMNTLA